MENGLYWKSGSSKRPTEKNKMHDENERRDEQAKWIEEKEKKQHKGSNVTTKHMSNEHEWL